MKVLLENNIYIIYRMKNYTVWEGSSIYDELNDNPAIEVGDTITYMTNNQMGIKKYTVILNQKGEKDVKQISDYDDWAAEDGYNSEDEGETKGGKRRKRKSNKKSHKKRKTNKRKTQKKRKTSKRKMRK